MIRTNQTSIWYPDYLATSALDIKLEELQAAGITHLVFDIDETLVPRRGNELTPEYTSYLRLIEQGGISILFGSNTRRDISSITQTVNARVVRPTKLKFKPRKAYFRSVIKTCGVGASQIAMVGDRIVNDIIGANRAGLVTILVVPFARKPYLLNKLYAHRLSKLMEESL